MLDIAILLAKMKKFLLVLIFILISFLPVSSQVKIKEIFTSKIDKPIKVDGFLNEPVWAEVPEAGDFIQFEPKRGKPASVKTVVKILYDEKFIYFGFFCYDAQPEKIAAQITKRDAELHDDDAVIVFLDTFHDRRNCYFFMTNLLGTQLDGRITENGRTRETTWDGIWKSAAQKTNFGWSAEIAVDLSCIKYEPGKNKTWGFNIGRIISKFLGNYR